MPTRASDPHIIPEAAGRNHISAAAAWQCSAPAPPLSSGLPLTVPERTVKGIFLIRHIKRIASTGRETVQQHPSPCRRSVTTPTPSARENKMQLTKTVVNHRKSGMPNADARMLCVCFEGNHFASGIRTQVNAIGSLIWRTQSSTNCTSFPGRSSAGLLRLMVSLPTTRHMPHRKPRWLTSHTSIL